MDGRDGTVSDVLYPVQKKREYIIFGGCFPLTLTAGRDVTTYPAKNF